MHFLMSFVRSIGYLMMNTGIDLILKSAFGSVEQMLNGKKISQNIRALRMVVEESLRPYLKDIHCIKDLTNFLHNISQRSSTSKLWIDCLIKPVFIHDAIY